MKKPLYERFQQLAGIKPLYETGNLNEFGITEQLGAGTGSIPDCHICDTSSGQPVLVTTPSNYEASWCTFYPVVPCYSFQYPGQPERCMMSSGPFQYYYGHVDPQELNGGQGCGTTTNTGSGITQNGCCIPSAIN